MRTRGERSFLSRPVVLVAAGSSCTIVVIAAFGAVTTPVIAAALGAACALGVVSYRGARPDRPAHALLPPGEEDGPMVVRAPKAKEIARQKESQTDAA